MICIYLHCFYRNFEEYILYVTEAMHLQHVAIDGYYACSSSPIFAKQIIPCAVGLGFSNILSKCHCAHADYVYPLTGI